MIQAEQKQTTEITGKVIFDNGYRIARSLMQNGIASPYVIREQTDKSRLHRHYSDFDRGMDAAAGDYENQS